MALDADLWVEPDDLADCDPTATPAEREAAARAASAALSGLTGGRWGTRSVTVRPLIRTTCGCGPTCGCSPERLRLPGHVSEVTSVTVDGDVLLPAAYALYDHAWLVRLDGWTWPLGQSLALASTEVGTLEVTYLAGMPLTAATEAAAHELACEMLKAKSGGECRLPTGVTNIVREGVAFTITDPSDLLSGGRTGLYSVDLWLATVNPGGLSRSPVVRNPEDVSARVTGP